MAVWTLPWCNVPTGSEIFMVEIKRVILKGQRVIQEKSCHFLKPTVRLLVSTTNKYCNDTTVSAGADSIRDFRMGEKGNTEKGRATEGTKNHAIHDTNP